MSSIKRSTERNLTLWQKVRSLSYNFAQQATTHGVRRIADAHGTIRRLFWAFIFITAVSGCLYHCSYIISRYLKFPKVTSTAEVHARELDFPALTVCNLNILKKDYFEDQKQNASRTASKGFCFDSDDDFLNQSEAKDLSDIWSKLGITSDSLKKYGHRVYDLIVQCTYNNKDCFNQSITKTLPLVTEHITITNYISTKLGLCHTIILNETTLGKVRRAGQTRGLTLTFNIERDQYLDLLSPEYGVRLLVHHRKSFPTVERGGISLHPGTKTYVSVKIREIKRLAYPFGECTTTFRDSPIINLLTKLDGNFTLTHDYYTYEYCQSLCRESLLLSNCSCVDEQLNSEHRFCNPCNTTQEECRTNFTDVFTADENNICTTLCKPACDDIRYDMQLSRSEWPNMEFMQFVLKKWPELISDFCENGTWDKGFDCLNVTFLNENFLRVHVFIQEMNYLFFQDIQAYSLPEMFADLGGCLGLYIGVSVISMIEMLELFTSIVALFSTRIRDLMNCSPKQDPNRRIRDSRTHNIQRLLELDKGNDMKPYYIQQNPRTVSRKANRIPSIVWARNMDKAYGNGFNEQPNDNKDVCDKCEKEIEILYRSHIFRRRHPFPTEDMYRRTSAHVHAADRNNKLL